MGLGGGRKRTKLSHDPNNTNWTSSEGYGRRLLQSKGWTPGASLGARGKSYTREKDTSYIRVSLKDDTLGLGAKSGVNLPPTGLDAFQGLLGRLNGKKDDELEKEQKTRDDLRRAVYTENRWGALRFIRGGFLVGDRIQEVGSDETPAEIPSDSRAEQAVPSKTDVSAIESTKALPNPVTQEVNVKRSKKSQKRKQSETADQPLEEAVNHQLPTFGHSPDIEERQSKGFVEGEEKLKRRSEKAERKLARQVRREEKRLRRSELAMEKKDLGVAELEAQDHARQAVAAEPMQFTASPTQHTRGRHNVRSRYVQQKKMALMNPKALNEVNDLIHEPYLYPNGLTDFADSDDQSLNYSVTEQQQAQNGP